jgi:cytochrome c2
MNHLSVSCTVEDVLTFNKKDIQEYLRSNQQKVSGTILELATQSKPRRRHVIMSNLSNLSRVSNVLKYRVTPLRKNK